MLVVASPAAGMLAAVARSLAASRALADERKLSLGIRKATLSCFEARSTRAKVEFCVNEVRYAQYT